MTVVVKKPNEGQKPDEEEAEDQELENQGEEEEHEEEETNFEDLYKQEQAKSNKLTDKVLELSGREPAKKGDQEDQEQQIEPPAAVKFLEEANLSDGEFQDFIGDKRAFMEKLNEFGNAVKLKAFEEIMASIPGIVGNIASFHVNLNEMNRQFFDNNPELGKMRKFVSGVADDLIRKGKVNDLQSYESILDQLPDAVKSRMDEMGLEAPKVDPKGKAKSTGQATPTGQRPGGKAGKTVPKNDFQRSLDYSKKRRV